jgi:hypothetical protein
MENTQPHWMAEHVSCDQLAECYEGVSQELYRRLYEALQNVKETVPAENCGSQHEYNECNGTMVSYHWEFFTEDERAEINEALGIQHGDDQF